MFNFVLSSFRNLLGKITIQEPTFDRIIVVYRYCFFFFGLYILLLNMLLWRIPCIVESIHVLMHSKLNQLGDYLILILSMLMMDIDGGGQIVSMKVSEISKLFYLRRLIFLNEEMGRIHSILQKILLLNLNKIWDYLFFIFIFLFF